MLAGGVLSGQSLIRAAELRSVSTDVIRYKTAVATFRDKYFQLPGDMNNAVRFWGAQAGATTDGIDATCAALTTAATSAATCNGDGDGNIGNFGAGGAYHETLRFWQHLANAGLVEGSYSGVPGSGSAFEVVVGTNVPKMRIGNSVGVSAAWGGVDLWGATVGNQFRVGGNQASTYNYTAFLKPEEAWNIDTKMDDGKPGTGTMKSLTSGFTPLCATTDVASTSVYNLSESSTRCTFLATMQ